MKKLAIFVEGKTERLFIDKLLGEIFGQKNIQVEHREISGGKTVPKQISVVSSPPAETGEKYYILICDCGGDHQVAQRVKEEHKNLSNEGYTQIIGIRDVSPTFTAAEIPQLEKGLIKNIDKTLIPVEFVLSVMELESWFLSEYNHFQKISNRLNPALIQSSLGFCPINDDMETRIRPSHDIHDCYQLAQKNYEKPAQETIEAIDYAFLYLEVVNKVPSLRKLITLFDNFV